MNPSPPNCCTTTTCFTITTCCRTTTCLQHVWWGKGASHPYPTLGINYEEDPSPTLVVQIQHVLQVQLVGFLRIPLPFHLSIKKTCTCQSNTCTCQSKNMYLSIKHVPVNQTLVPVNQKTCTCQSNMYLSIKKHVPVNQTCTCQSKNMYLSIKHVPVNQKTCKTTCFTRKTPTPWR
ncbi:hypothetical protein ACQ4LE_001707 [Meloidogyne hapla]